MGVAQFSYAQNVSKKETTVVKKEISQAKKVGIVTGKGKDNKPIVEYVTCDRLPEVGQDPSNPQAQVMIFSNECTRTCTPKPGTNESGNWSLDSSTGHYHCDGVAGPCVPRGRAIKVNPGKSK